VGTINGSSENSIVLYVVPFLAAGHLTVSQSMTMRLSCLLMLCVMLLGAGCSTPSPVSPAALAKARAREDIDRLNARVVLAYQKRQEAIARVQEFQTGLRHPGLSPKERANYQIDLEEAIRQVKTVSEHVAELEEELNQEWAAYRAQYGPARRLAGPLSR
jgi:hypothetical protein